MLRDVMEVLPELVLVCWEDAVEMDDTPWVDCEEPADYEPLLVYTTGWLLHQDYYDGVIITSTVQENSTARRDQIPRGMIRKLIVLREAGPPPT